MSIGSGGRTRSCRSGRPRSIPRYRRAPLRKGPCVVVPGPQAVRAHRRKGQRGRSRRREAASRDCPTVSLPFDRGLCCWTCMARLQRWRGRDRFAASSIERRVISATCKRRSEVPAYTPSGSFAGTSTAERTRCSGGSSADSEAETRVSNVGGLRTGVMHGEAVATRRLGCRQDDSVLDELYALR